jgi:hypothetical protein
MSYEPNFFCCSECGARYKVILDGKKYQFKKCSELYFFPAEALPLRHYAAFPYG